MYRPNLQSVALPVPQIIAIAVLGGGCEAKAVGGQGYGTVRKSVGEFI